MSLYDLAGRCEVDRAALSRFARGKAGLSIEALDRLANALGLVVVVRGE
jgi:transcriptional regulator with XRE-family HTH domain